jgi:NAD(P)-dependent dehydrogenase (short-subunit alcohol dehydrogenase family)
VTGDCAAEADAERLVTAAQRGWGGVDALVNCAAVRLRAPLLEIGAAAFAEVLRINLVGAFVLTKSVVPAMRARQGGSVVHLGSALGSVAAPDFSPYVASKGGLHLFARAAAVELVQDEIRVNVVAPGTIDTPMGQGVPEFRRHLLKHRIPIGRAGHVGDVASVCLFLASEASRYVTGAIWAVDGGWTAS